MIEIAIYVFILAIGFEMFFLSLQQDLIERYMVKDSKHTENKDLNRIKVVLVEKKNKQMAC